MDSNIRELYRKYQLTQSREDLEIWRRSLCRSGEHSETITGLDISPKEYWDFEKMVKIRPENIGQRTSIYAKVCCWCKRMELTETKKNVKSLTLVGYDVPLIDYIYSPEFSETPVCQNNKELEEKINKLKQRIEDKKKETLEKIEKIEKKGWFKKILKKFLS